MKRWRLFVCVFGIFLFSIIHPVHGGVVFSNYYQEVKVQILGDGDILAEEASNHNWGTDADLTIEANYWGYGYGSSQLKTTYLSNKLTVDGRVFLNVSPCFDYEKIAARGHIYYYTNISVTDQPVWLKISGYLTPGTGHQANDHFLVGAPGWYWYVDYNLGEKVWMFDTVRLEAGDHALYGAVDYTITADWGGSDDNLYADYYFAVEVVDPPVFEPSQADFDRNGKVNLADLALFAGAWLWGQ